MVLKQALTVPTMEPKKRRRVGFSSIDVGVEANDCIKIFLVSRKEEVSAEGGGFPIEPIDLNQFFEEEDNKDGKIYGYQNLKINIFFSSISFLAYADITFESTSNGGKGVTDLKPALQKIFGESLVENKDAFLQTFTDEIHYIRDAVSDGEVLHRVTAKQAEDKSRKQLEADDFTVEHQVIRMPMGSTPVGEFYCRLVPLVLLLVDGGSPIDIDDPSWELYLVVESKTNDHGDASVKLLGFAAMYRFYHYPDTSRLRISQILVLPPYQGQGKGTLLLEVLNSVGLSDNVYDMTVEEPSDHLQHLRTCIDMHRLVAFEPIKDAVCSVASRLKQGKFQKKTCKSQSDPPTTAVENVRQTFKITKKQFLRCWEILTYLELDHNDTHCMENYSALVTERMREDILGKDTGAAGKQVLEVQKDEELAFVMFRPSDNVKLENVNAEIEVNENQEEQLKQLVDERMEEIMKIAKKVSVQSC